MLSSAARVRLQSWNVRREEAKRKQEAVCKERQRKGGVMVGRSYDGTQKSTAVSCDVQFGIKHFISNTARKVITQLLFYCSSHNLTLFYCSFWYWLIPDPQEQLKHLDQCQLRPVTTCGLSCLEEIKTKQNKKNPEQLPKNEKHIWMENFQHHLDAENLIIQGQY